MRKTELKNEIERIIDELMNYKLSEMLLQSINEARTDIEKNATAEILTDELNLLSGWLNEFKKDGEKTVNKDDTKKALEKKAEDIKSEKTFKWLSLDGYNLISVKNASFDDINEKTVIAYRMDKTVISNLKKRKIEYSDTIQFDNASFDNDIDYCKILEKTSDYVDVESIKNVGATFRIWADNFKKCIDDTNVAFRILEKIA